MLPENCPKCGVKLTPDRRTSAGGTGGVYCSACGVEIFPVLLPMNCPVCHQEFSPVPRRKPDGTWGAYCSEPGCDSEIDTPKIGPYKIADYIRGGGFSCVYLGLLDYSTDPVAIKFLSAFYVSDDDANRRFRREAYAMEQVRHENICRLVGFGRLDDTPFIIMEYVEGETLREAINDIGKRKPSISYWMDIVVQIAEGLAAAHKRGIFHRDLKPENIKIKPHADDPDRSVVKILDFGLARIEIPFNQVLKSIAATLIQPTSPGKQVGTLVYMSPEQIKAEPRLGEASDIFSFGVILHEIFSGGRRPFDRSTDIATIAAITSDPPEPLRKINPSVPRTLESIVLKALQKDKKDRYKTESILRDLKRFQNRPRTVGGWIKQNLKYLVVGLLVLVAILALAAHAFAPRPLQ